MKYVSLHHHSTYSFMDGFGTPAQHIERIADLGMEAMALTEHGNVSSHVPLEKAAKKVGIKPIFGLEAYTALEPESRRKFHLSILAMDQTGYANLMSLVSRSWAEGFYQWPTVSGSMLADHSEGLIVLSGCSDSLLACSLLGGKTIEPADASWDRAVALAERFQDLFGDRFYLETQMFPELERTCDINKAYERLGKQLKIPLVATTDCHYPLPDDNEMQVILHAAGRGAGTVAAQEATWEYDIRLTSPESDAKVLERLRGTGLSKRAATQAWRSTGEIASRCNVVLPKAGRLRYPCDNSEELVWDWLRKGWVYRIEQGNTRLVEQEDEYVRRLRYEMEIITSKDFVDYFLMLSDLVRYAKDAGIPVGPARGSAAASLACYLLRITEIDPLEYPLMYFERFIAPDREDIPDIDLDFDDERRHEVKDYATAKYGEDRVGNIGTFTKYKGKNSIDDVARVFSIPKSDTEQAKSMIVERSGGDSRSDQALADTLDMFPAAKAIFEKHRDLYKALRLEGNYRGMSTHAAGLVVTERPVAETCALYTREKPDGSKTVAVSVDKKDAEYLGLMKVDVLGLSTMGMIRIALELAGLTLEDLYRVPMTDARTIEAFRDNDVVGIFQFEGRATRLVNREVRPDNFLELADINGLSRPGPLFSGTTADYIAVKHGKQDPPKYHPKVDEVTAPTKGCIIYQEQVLRILADIGGLPVRRVHEIRKIISQKLGEAQFNASAEDFVKGAARLHGIKRKEAETIWGRLVTSATYSFNIAHCVSYSMLGFWCMWLKVHYPAAFYTAQLRKTEEDKWPRLIRDAEAHGVTVRGVTPGLSGGTWRIAEDGSTVVAGWLQLKGVGPATAAKIIAYDDAQHVAGRPGIECAEDLLNISGIGPKTLEKFRDQMDTHDPFGLRRITEALDAVRASIRSKELPLRNPTHRSNEIIDVPGGSTVIWIGQAKLKEYKDYIEDERARSGKSLDEIRKTMKRPDLPTSCVIHCFDDEEEDVYVRVTRFDYPKFKAGLQRIRTRHDVVYVVARKSNGGFGASLYVKDLVVIDPE